MGKSWPQTTGGTQKSSQRDRQDVDHEGPRDAGPVDLDACRRSALGAEPFSKSL
jgi:hypothetical protein